MEKGLEYCKSEYVFYCHADVIACKPDWMLQLFNKIVKDGYSLASFHGHWGYSSWHPDRVDACHSGGILTTTELARKVSMQPIYKDGIILWDSCAQLTKYCIENDLKYFWFNNSILPTHHYEKVPGNKPFDKLVRVTKCFDDDDKVIYLHLGRGVPRSIGQYTKVKDGIVTTQGWFDFTKKYILDA